MFQFSLRESSPVRVDTQYLCKVTVPRLLIWEALKQWRKRPTLTLQSDLCRQSLAAVRCHMKAVLWETLLQFTVYIFRLSFHPSSHFLSNEQFDNCFNKHLLEREDLYFPLELNLFSTSRLPVYLVHSWCTTYLSHDFSYPSTQLKPWISSWLPQHPSLWPGQMQSCLSYFIQNTTAKMLSLSSFFWLGHLSPCSFQIAAASLLQTQLTHFDS